MPCVKAKKMAALFCAAFLQSKYYQMLNLDQIFDEVAVMLAEELSGAESTRFRNALKKDIV